MPRTLLAAGSLVVLVVLAFSTPAIARPEGDPPALFHFGLEVDGAPLGLFRSVEGLGSENEVTEFISGGDGTVHKIPGRLRYFNVTLERGLTADLTLVGWRDQVESGDFPAARKNASLILYDSSLTVIARWQLHDAWPSKLEALADPEGGLFVEKMTLAVERMSRVAP